MSVKLRPHPAYKDSGVAWLGRIPRDWKVSRIKTVLREVECRGDGEGTLLSLTRVRGLIAHSDRTEKMHSAKSLVGYKQYLPGQIVMNRMQAWSGMFGTGGIAGLVSPDYAVFEVLGRNDVRLILQRLKAPDAVGQFALESKGIGSGFNRLYTDRFGAIPVSLPPPDEQAAIVRFLSAQEQRIAQLIRVKRRLIEVLNEQKQAIIQRAVTRGLDPSAPLKPSGIPWLGNIPAHWDIVRNSRIFRERNDRGSGELPLLIVSLNTGVTIGSEVDESGRPRRLILDRDTYKIAREGDIAYNMMRMWQGAVGSAPCDGLVSPAYVVAAPFAGIVSRYFALLFRTLEYMSAVNRSSRGIVSDRNRLYWDNFKTLPSTLPPEGEQCAIVEHVARETAGADKVITTTLREIALIREYRTRLVSDVVTGKLDVRGITVPEAASEPLAAEALDTEPEELEEAESAE